MAAAQEICEQGALTLAGEAALGRYQHRMGTLHNPRPLAPGARAPVLRRLLPCASRRAPSGARPAAMPAAYTDDLAWRVVMRVHFFRQDVATVCDSRLGWACRGTT